MYSSTVLLLCSKLTDPAENCSNDVIFNIMRNKILSWIIRYNCYTHEVFYISKKINILQLSQRLSPKTKKNVPQALLDFLPPLIGIC